MLVFLRDKFFIVIKCLVFVYRDYKWLKVNNMLWLRLAVKKWVGWILSFNKEEILVLGDSHVAVFSENVFKDTWPHYFFNVVSVGGGTISGLKNPNSKSQAVPIFDFFIEGSNANKCVVCLGEVDVGFLIWHKVQQSALDVGDLLEVTVKSYKHFLKKLAANFEVYCVSAPLPTISDGEVLGEVANLRKEVRATQKERTDLTRCFNERMMSECEELGVNYIMLDEVSLSESGFVKEELLNSDCKDHHYDAKVYSQLLSKSLLSEELF